MLTLFYFKIWLKLNKKSNNYYRCLSLKIKNLLIFFLKFLFAMPI
jgi:hypothetical protein